MTTAPQDLGRLEEIDSDLEAGVFLWRRFVVVNEPRKVSDQIVVDVEDVDQKLGDPPGYRLALHMLEAPASPEIRARIRRALAIDSRVQARVFAAGECGDKLVLLGEPVVGTPADGEPAATGTTDARPTLAKSEFLVMGTQLAELLTKLHEAGAHGVHFERSQLRVEGGHYTLDGFGHLFGAARSPEQDVAGLIEFLREIGGATTEVQAATDDTPSSARALWQRLRALWQSDERLAEFELPADPPFVGRTRAMLVLEAATTQARIAKPTAVVVAGERGVGKSRLLREFVSRQLKSNNYLILTGAWQTRSGDTRSGLLGALEQLPRALSRLEVEEREEIRRNINRATRHLGAIVARSAPALGTVLRHAEELPQLELSGDFSRHTAVLADVLKSLGTRQRPLVLVLDNLESADANSAAVLEIITQSRPAHYTLVVTGLRTELDGYTPKFDYDRLDISPFTLEEVSELVERTLPGTIEGIGSIAKRLLAQSDGLPLALGGTLRAWIDHGYLVRGLDDGVWRARKSLRDDGLHDTSVRSLFNARLADMSDSGRELAMSLAVFGIELRNEDLAPLTEKNGSAVRELSERGLLVRTQHGVRFPHDTIRELVLESMSDEQRRAAHALAAEVLTKQDAPLSQIVYHRDLSFDNEHGNAEAFDNLSKLHVEAGRDRLDVYDLERARWHLERALEHSHDPEQRGLAAEGLADICLLQEDIDTAVSLYTAIIATSTPADAVRVAAKAAQFLYGKNANSDAAQLGKMALEMANEPTPTTVFGKLWVAFGSLLRSWFSKCTLSFDLRDGLCRLYVWMDYIALIDDPESVPLYTSRGRWIALGLETGSAAIVRSTEGAVLTVLGFATKADEIFEISNKIAQGSKDAWAQGMVFHHWGGALLASNRYASGQDRLDDGIAAFRETGDVSIALISMFYKGIYGRDREHADVILGWVDEALTTARRNGKRTAFLPMQALKLHILARQGRMDLDERLAEQAAEHERGEVPGMERLASKIELAYACLETANLELATRQIHEGLALADEMGGAVPEFCQEIFLVSAFVLLAKPMRTRTEGKLLRQVVRKFRSATKRSPRLAVFGDLLTLKLAMDSGSASKIHRYASKLVSDFEIHENLDAARQAHRALARLLKGDNVLAAAEHERLARNIGRRMGLSDHVLLSDFSEIGREVGILALTEESGFSLEESRHGLPAAGMLTSSVDDSERNRSAKSEMSDEQSDVLEAWALTDVAPPRASLGSILEPVRAAVGDSIDDVNLEISCSNPDLEIPVASGDLQILLINMLLACRDAVGPQIKVSARLDTMVIDEVKDPERTRLKSGHYLSVLVSAQGGGSQIPVIGAFTTCEKLAQVINGSLKASTHRGKVTLHAHVPLEKAVQDDLVAPPPHVGVVHSNADVRQTIGAALDQLGVPWQALEPKDVTPHIEDVTVILAESALIHELTILQPLLSARLIEVCPRGAETTLGSYEALYIPLTVSELEDLLGLF